MKKTVSLNHNVNPLPGLVLVRNPRRWLPLLVLLAGLVFTSFAAYYTWRGGEWHIAPLFLFAGGVTLSVVLFRLIRSEAHAREDAEHAAAQLIASEKALRESEERLRNYAAELEKRVAERTANLAQSIQSLEGVLYHVAHDLRAPLRSMSSFTNILLEDYGPQFDERGRDYARRIAKSAQHMDRLVQDLLAYGRLAHTEVPLNNISLEAELNAVLEQFGEEINAAHAQVEVQRPLPAVKANPALLAQVISNLLSNALKFVAPGVAPRVRIWAEHEDSMVRFWIEDNGIGIKPEYHQRVFNMFERLHATEAYPGTGIGLAIVRKAAERMNGSVGLESQPGQGCRFWVRLPAA